MGYMCLFLLLLLFFTLQYYIGFAIHQHESAMGIHVFELQYLTSLKPNMAITAADF